MGVAGVDREYLLYCAKSGKSWCTLTSGSPAVSNRAKARRVLCAVLAGGGVFNGGMHIFGFHRFATADGFQDGQTGPPLKLQLPPR